MSARLRSYRPSGRGLVASALARAEAWLLEPVGQACEPASAPASHPVVAVFGLARGSGGHHRVPRACP